MAYRSSSLSTPWRGRRPAAGVTRHAGHLPRIGFVAVPAEQVMIPLGLDGRCAPIWSGITMRAGGCHHLNSVTYFAYGDAYYRPIYAGRSIYYEVVANLVARSRAST